MTKIAAIVNKNWETEAVVSAIVNIGLRPAALPFPKVIHIPDYSEKSTNPRLVFELADGIEVTLWCIQDMMYYDGAIPPERQSGSSSEEKHRVLQGVLDDYNPDLVISVSTAGYPGDFGCNGSVVVGGNFFIHDAYAEPKEPNPFSNLKDEKGRIGKLLKSNVNPKLFSIINDAFKNKVEPKFLNTPRNPCEHPCCIASKVFTAVSVVNVTDYTEYNWADHEAMAHFKEVEKQLPCNSSETTHGVVKLCTDKPIIFLSPITDQFGHFDFEVTPTQNFAASFNGGIVLGQLLCDLVDYIKSGNTF